MVVRAYIVIALVLVVLAVRGAATQVDQNPTPAVAAIPGAPIDPQGAKALVDRYCVGCHSTRLKTGGLVLEGMDFEHVAARADVFEKVLRKVQVGMMPPVGLPRPEEAVRTRFTSFLERELDQAVLSRPSPGRPVLRRLNRSEYANAIRDLLDLNIDATTLLPADDQAYGFDNVADLLGVSPTLLDRYLTAADMVSSLAVGDPGSPITALTFRVRQDASQDVHIEGQPLGTVGGVVADVTLPLDAEYELASKLYRTNLGAMRGLEYEHQVEYTVDGLRVHLAKLGGDEDFKASLANVTTAGDAVDARTRVRLRLKAGPHRIGAAFLKRSDAANPLRLQPFIRSSSDTLDATGHPHFELFSVTGPYNATGPGDTPTRRRIFSCRPTAAAQQASCARRIIASLARAAYRGQQTPTDLERLYDFYAMGSQKGGFDAGIQLALRRILASPKFVFRAEAQPPTAKPGESFAVTDVDLATRLSFFLWSSIPDDTLLQLATRNRLRDPMVLQQQVRRMLADSKSEAFVRNFAGQWLYLRNLKNQQPNSNDFPDFDDNLRDAFEQEVLLLFNDVLRADRSVLDLMSADYTFVNQRLARHYGIPHVVGSHFRKVAVTDEARKGLLGKGAILAVTSHADRTSPVLRGKWVLENLLGTPPPPPPPVVPPLPDTNENAGKVLTMRERMETHRANAVCASCHRLMDPIGLAMENFDAVGAWRTREGGRKGTPIDPAGQLMDGTQVAGVVELRTALLRHPEVLVGTIVEKLMIFALGRGIEPTDMPVVREIVRDSAKTNYRLTSLIDGVINSPQFRLRTAAASTGAAQRSN